MFANLRTWVLLISLMALGVLALPATTGPDPSRNATRPLEVENARALLGEEPAEARNVPEKGKKIAARATGVVRLSVPRLGIEDLPVPAGSTQTELDREGIIRLKGTGLPGVKDSNTFIVGHALGYPSTRVRFVFRHLEKMKPGDEITLNSGGEQYTFRVYDRLTVRPEDYWVTYPVTGKTVISLQSCTPYPTFENRIVVRGELVGREAAAAL
jgi:sortase A